MSFSLGAGDVVGKYRVERVIGVGGMGVVVAATHLALGEPVALKFLVPAAAADPDAVTRFLREGRFAAKIRSEHVVRILDVGTLDTGAPYLVMELLRGEGLDALLRQGGPLSIERAVDLVLQACEAIAEAHALGIVHRDLKPSNLFVARRPDGSACVKVLDFGVSKSAEPDGWHPAMDMTTTASMLGSPRYMAPEQMASARDVDARADLWSIGAVLYELMTGERPFPAANVPELCKKVLEGRPVPMRTHMPDVPEDLERAVLRCLERDRNHRTASVLELAEALSPYASQTGRISLERIRGVVAAAASGELLEPPGALPPSAPGDAATAPLARRPFEITPPRGNSTLDVTQSAAETASPVTERRPRARSRALLAALALVATATLSLAVFSSRRGPGSRPEDAPAPPPTASDVAPPRAAPPPAERAGTEPALDRGPEPPASAPPAMARPGVRRAPSSAASAVPSGAPSGKLFGSRDW